MTQQSYVVMICDRCDKIEDGKGRENFAWDRHWGKILVAQASGAHWVGSASLKPLEAKDLCPECVRAVYDWFNEKQQEEKPHARIGPVPDND